MSEVVLVILAVTVLLLLVSLIVPLADRFALPETMLLAGLGLALGAVAVAVSQTAALGIVGDVFSGLLELGLSADAFLYLFLPPLLFTAGLTIDVRLLFDEFAAVLLMAVVAVVVCTGAVGYALAGVSEVGLVACLLLGAIVATTDPAAVIGIFRDLGAPRRLSILVAGESLFNDAAAIALFTILLGMLTGKHEADMLGGGLMFLRDFAGGAALGYAMARGACLLLDRLYSVPVAQITVTVGLAYLAFIVGEDYLGVSGVVAVVTAALTFVIYGRTRLSPDTWATLIQTWRQLEFWANSLIFVLAAMLAARAIPDLTWAGLGGLLVLIVAALVARALVLYGLLPVLSLVRLVQPVDGRYKLVVLWGGLRGAVTVTLALSISQHPEVSADVQQFVAALATGFVLFTLFIGAPTLRPLLRVLGLDRLSPIELALRDRVMALSRSSVRKQVNAVARDYGFDPELAAEVAPAEGNPSEAGSAEASSGDGNAAGDTAAEAAAYARMPEETRLQVGLLTLASREKELYLEHFNEQTISRRMVAILVARADRLIDRVKASGLDGYEQTTRGAVRLTRGFRIALWLQRRLGWDAPLAARLADRFEALIVAQLVVRELAKFNRRSVKPLLGEDIGTALDGLLAKRLKAIEDGLAAVELQYPGYAAALRAQYLTRAAIRLEFSEYKRSFDESLISREVFGDLQENLRRRIRAIDQRPPLDLGLNLSDMIAQVPIFGHLDRYRHVTLARLLKPRLAMPGERIILKGTRGDAMFFLASGQVEVKVPEDPTRLGPGSFFGELALLTHLPRTADVVALGYCNLLALESRDFAALLRNNPDLKAEIEGVAQHRLANIAGEHGV